VTELEPAPTPADSLCALVATSAALLYWAEEGKNPNIKDYWDAFHYIATSLSVGYANIFPATPLGKIIGAAVQMVGPALSARALDGGGDLENRALLDKMDEILVELRRLNSKDASDKPRSI
jgi:hypothetical protein